MSKWRNKAKAVIAEALQDVTTTDPDDLRKLLHDAYPFGAREYTPYKIWCDEVNTTIAQRTGVPQTKAQRKAALHPWMKARELAE